MYIFTNNSDSRKCALGKSPGLGMEITPRPSAKFRELGWVQQLSEISTTAAIVAVVEWLSSNSYTLRNNDYPSPYSCPGEASHRLCCMFSFQPSHPPPYLTSASASTFTFPITAPSAISPLPEPY